MKNNMQNIQNCYRCNIININDDEYIMRWTG